MSIYRLSLALVIESVTGQSWNTAENLLSEFIGAFRMVLSSLDAIIVEEGLLASAGKNFVNHLGPSI